MLSRAWTIQQRLTTTLLRFKSRLICNNKTNKKVVKNKQRKHPIQIKISNPKAAVPKMPQQELIHQVSIL